MAGRVSWKELKQQADPSLYVFAQRVLGYPDLQPQPHAEMCRFLQIVPFGEQSPAKFRMLGVPRDCFKTTVGTVAYTLWLVTKFPNITLLITTHTESKSLGMLQEIKQHLEGNATFRRLYGDLQSTVRWDREGIVVSTRTHPNKTPTIQTASVDGAVTSDHYDVIICDDLHNEKNYQTPELRKRVLNHLCSLLPLLRPHGFMLLIYTRWHPFDCYGWAEQNLKPLKKLVRGWKNHGKLYFPGKLTENFIAMIRQALTNAGNAKLFHAWYENSPISTETVAIHPDWRQLDRLIYVPVAWDYGYIHRQPGTPQEEKHFVRVCGVIDPADSETSSSDFTGITLKGIDQENNWWVFRGLRLHERPFLTIRKVVELAQQCKVSTWGMETAGGREIYRAGLQEAFLQQQVLGRVLKLPTMGRAKADRIGGLTGKFEARTIIIDAGQTDLLEELDYPEVAHDDVIDSLAYHLLMDIRPPSAMEEVQQEVRDIYEMHPDERAAYRAKQEGRLPNRNRMTGY